MVSDVLVNIFFLLYCVCLEKSSAEVLVHSKKGMFDIVDAN